MDEEFISVQNEHGKRCQSVKLYSQLSKLTNLSGGQLHCLSSHPAVSNKVVCTPLRCLSTHQLWHHQKAVGQTTQGHGYIWYAAADQPRSYRSACSKPRAMILTSVCPVQCVVPCPIDVAWDYQNILCGLSTSHSSWTHCVAVQRNVQLLPAM